MESTVCDLILETGRGDYAPLYELFVAPGFNGVVSNRRTQCSLSAIMFLERLSEEPRHPRAI